MSIQYKSSIIFLQKRTSELLKLLIACTANVGFHNHIFTSANFLAQDTNVCCIATAMKQRQATREKGARVALPNRQKVNVPALLMSKLNYKDCPIFQGQRPSLSLVPEICDN